MTNIGRPFLIMALAGWALVAGCQNNIHIRVERVLGVSSVSRDSGIGRQISDTVDNLTRIIDRCQDAQASAAEFIAQFPETAGTPEAPAPTQRSVAAQLESYLIALDTIAQRSREFRAECEGWYEPTEAGRRRDDPRGVLGRVRDFMEARRDDLLEWPEMLRDIPVLGDLGTAESARAADWAVKYTDSQISRGDDFLVSIQGVGQQAGKTSQQAKKGFGGFVSTDVYPINPSDPYYAEILKSSSPIASAIRIPFWQSTSLEPITEVKVGASGDSAVMIVMEHPAQVRVYQVSNDPAQLTRNIGLLINKATGAAAKYLSAGVVP
jgi:hypothetical protein